MSLPTNIILIRHGEKPPKDNTQGPFDVLESGEPGHGNSLIVPGWQRAGAMCNFFAPKVGAPANPLISVPDFIFTASPHGETRRPWETVLPLAAWLGYVGPPQFNTEYSIGKDESTVVGQALACAGTVLICWEHNNLAGAIVPTIAKQISISNQSDIPAQWPDVYDMVWTISQTGTDSVYQWRCTKQNLVPGDTPAVSPCL